MRISVQRERGVMALCGMVLAAVLLSTGCEWTGTDQEGAWNSRMNWVNFSGLYRSGNSSRALVENFSLSSGGAAGSSEVEDQDYIEHAVSGEPGHVQPSPFTVMSGTIDYLNRGTTGWSLKPGGVTIRFTGTITAPEGVVNDNGNGGLAGTYAQVPGGPTFAATGSINYDTGAWSIILSANDPFIEPAQVSYSYIILQAVGAADVSPGSDPPTSQGWVYSLQIEQYGNRLRMTDNRGYEWTGRVINVTTPAGDTSGNTSGEVVAVFEAQRTQDSRYRITGSFSGLYTVSAGDQNDRDRAGQLTQRRMQGIWMEPSGHGDLYGVTGDGGLQVIAPLANP